MDLLHQSSKEENTQQRGGGVGPTGSQSLGQDSLTRVCITCLDPGAMARDEVQSSAGAASPSAQREEEEDGGPLQTAPEPSSSVSPAPQHSMGGGRGHFPRGLQDLCFRYAFQENADFSCLISTENISSPIFFAAVSHNSKTRPKTWLFLHFPPGR